MRAILVTRMYGINSIMPDELLHIVAFSSGDPSFVAMTADTSNAAALLMIAPILCGSLNLSSNIIVPFSLVSSSL